MIRASAFASQVVVVSEVSDEWAVCRGSGWSWLLIISMTLDSVQSNSLQELSWSVMEHDNMRQWWPASGNTRNIMSWDLTPDTLLVLIPSLGTWDSRSVSMIHMTALKASTTEFTVSLCERKYFIHHCMVQVHHIHQTCCHVNKQSPPSYPALPAIIRVNNNKNQSSTTSSPENYSRVWGEILIRNWLNLNLTQEWLQDLWGMKTNRWWFKQTVGGEFEIQILIGLNGFLSYFLWLRGVLRRSDLLV